MNIGCTLFGHKYTTTRKITSDIRELKCKRCKREFGMNDSLKLLLPLDNDLKILHDIIKKD